MLASVLKNAILDLDEDVNACKHKDGEGVRLCVLEEGFQEVKEKFDVDFGSLARTLRIIGTGTSGLGKMQRTHALFRAGGARHGLLGKIQSSPRSPGCAPRRL